MKSKSETWLGIANLILTAIVGIGIAIFLQSRDAALQKTLKNQDEKLQLALQERDEQLQLVLKDRDEEIQKSVVAIQADYEKEIVALEAQYQKDLSTLQLEQRRAENTAHLQLSRPCLTLYFCEGTVDLTNLGPAKAQNIKAMARIVLDPSWTSVIDDISAFEIEKLPALMDLQVTNSRVESLYDYTVISGDNAFAMAVDSLPTGSSMRLRIAPKSIDGTAIYSSTQITTVHLGANEAEDNATVAPSAKIGNLLIDYLADQYKIGILEFMASCENCEEIVSLRVRISSLQGYRYTEIDSGNQEDEEWVRFRVSTSYDLPTDASDFPNNDPVELLLLGPDESGEFSLVEMPKQLPASAE